MPADLCATLAQTLPAGVVLDGEVLIWDPLRGRSSFAHLRRRLSAGRRITAEALTRPAHMVSFDLLRDARGRELLDLPLTTRRRRLQRLLAGAPPQLAVCPQTTDRAIAEQWFTDLSVAGIEGCVVKPASSRYLPGRPGWWKARTQETADYVVGGVTGTWRQPTSLLLGRYDRHQTLRFLGQTHPLKADQRREVAALLQATTFQGAAAGHPWPNPLPAGWSVDLTDRQPLPYAAVEPTLVIVVVTDTVTDEPWGRLRHRATHVRVRPDLRPRDVDLAAGTRTG